MEIRCTIGSSILTVNGEAEQLDTAPYIRNSRTFLPLRAVSEALQMNVEWDGDSRTISLSSPYQTARILALAESLNVRELGAKKAIHDSGGFWVLQFETSSEAKAALEKLLARGIPAEPDSYLRVEPEDVSVPWAYAAGAPNTFPVPVLSSGAAAADSHDSYIPAYCGFDDFRKQHAALFQGESIVAVVDNSTYTSHPKLKNRTLPGIDLTDGKNDPPSLMSHGTAVAGIIADCTEGLPVKILPIRVLRKETTNDQNTFASCLTKGIYMASDAGADVINISLGLNASVMVETAINSAIRRGALVVMSAGNGMGGIGISDEEHFPSNI